MDWIGIYQDIKPVCDGRMTDYRLSMLIGWLVLFFAGIFVFSHLYRGWKNRTMGLRDLLALLPVIIIMAGLTAMHLESLGEPYAVQGRIVAKTVGGHAVPYLRLDATWARELKRNGPADQSYFTVPGLITLRTENELWDQLNTGETGLFIVTPTDTIFRFQRAGVDDGGH